MAIEFAYLCSSCGSPIEVGVASASRHVVAAGCTNPACTYFGPSSQKHFGWARLQPIEDTPTALPPM